MNTFVDAFRFIGDNSGLLLSKTGEHLELSAVALGIALVLALPLGLWLDTCIAAFSSRPACRASGARFRVWR
jgi:ABC-type proline/glycine betaine transport system permease subunit